MTVSIGLATVADSISNLSISGVTIKDIDQIPDSAAMLCPLLIPQPNGFVSDINPEFQSFGSNAAQKMDLSYTLNYLYLHAEVGSGINSYLIYSGLITKLIAIIAAIMSNDKITGLVDMKLQSVSQIGVITDPSGAEFWGIQFSFRVLEYVNG